MAKLHAGTSGWAYPNWKPDFYPEKLAQKKFLNYYASQLNSVEVNYTFRHMASAKTLDNWIKETPDHFCFCVKAHQVITHIKRLKDADEIMARFLSSIEPLLRTQRLGPVLFQLPPNLKADTSLLGEFLVKLPRALKATFEFRNASWFSDGVYDILRKHNAALCVAESEERDTPDVATADFYYARLRKPDYSPEERTQIIGRMKEQVAAGRDTFVFFKHEETPEGAQNAVELLKAFGS